MLKKWTVVLIPLALLGLSGCASTHDEDPKTVAKECNKVTSTGSNIGRCKK